MVNHNLTHRRKSFRSVGGGGGVHIEETWDCTPGTYTSGTPTGSDWTWIIDDCSGSGNSGVVIPNPADGTAQLNGDGDDYYFKCNDIEMDSTNNELIIPFMVPATNGGEVTIWLYSANASYTVFQLDIIDEDEIYVKYNDGSPAEVLVDSTAGGGVEFDMKFTVDISAKTFDYDINGETGTGLGWRDDSGTGDDEPVRLEMYISNNGSNQKELGNIQVGTGIV